MRDFIVIIPVYNAAKNIHKIINDLILAVPYIHYIIIDDGSSDTTAQICQEKDYNIISHSSSYGLETALETGYKFALKYNYKYIIRFDGSGFYSPHDIKAFIKLFNEKFDIILGFRFALTKKSKTELKLYSNLIYKYNNKRLKDLTTGFLGMSARVAKNIISNKNKTLNPSFLSQQISDGFVVTELQVSYVPSHKNKYFNKNKIFQALAHNFAYKLLKRKKGN